MQQIRLLFTKLFKIWNSVPTFGKKFKIFRLRFFKEVCFEHFLFIFSWFHQWNPKNWNWITFHSTIRRILFNRNVIYLVLSCMYIPVIWANIWICDSWFPLTQSRRTGGDWRDEWVSSGHHLFSTRVAGSGRRNAAGWDRYSRAVSWSPDRGHSAGPLSVPRFHIQTRSRVPFHRRVSAFLLVF